MIHQKHRRHQAQVVDSVVRTLREQPAVLGVAICGSMAHGSSNAFSDVDMVCYLRDEHRTGMLELRNLIRQLLPVISHVWVYDRNALYLLESGVRLDLDFNRPSEIGWANRQSSSILYDPDGQLEKHIAPSAAPNPPDPMRYMPDAASLLEWYFWMFRQTYCWARGGGLASHRWFDKRRGALQSLTEIRNGLVDVRLWLARQSDYLPNVDPDMAQRLAATFPSLDEAQILQATRALLSEFERLMPEFCRRHGLAWPAKALSALHAMLDEFDRA